MNKLREGIIMTIIIRFLSVFCLVCALSSCSKQGTSADSSTMGGGGSSGLGSDGNAANDPAKTGYGGKALSTAAPLAGNPTGTSGASDGSGGSSSTSSVSLAGLLGNPGWALGPTSPLGPLPPMGDIGPEFELTALHSTSDVHCPSVGNGWVMAEEKAVVTAGTSTLSVVCLYWRLRSDGYKAEYTITHAGADKTDSVNCASKPPSGGYHLKGGGCVKEGANGCYSDVCFWERTSAAPSIVVISHAGGNTGDNVDCRNNGSGAQGPLPSAGVDRIPLLSYGTNVYSDLCLWKYDLQLPGRL